MDRELNVSKFHEGRIIIRKECGIAALEKTFGIGMLQVIRMKDVNDFGV